MRPKSRESTENLGRILDVFAAGRPEELGQIRNGIFAGILAELLAYRKAEDGELEAARAMAGVRFGHLPEIEGVPRIVLAGARFKSALVELNSACDEVYVDRELDKAGLESIVATVGGLVDKIVNLMMQDATGPGDVQGPDLGVKAPELEYVDLGHPTGKGSKGQE